MVSTMLRPEKMYETSIMSMIIGMATETRRVSKMVVFITRFIQQTETKLIQRIPSLLITDGTISGSVNVYIIYYLLPQLPKKHFGKNVLLYFFEFLY